MNIHPDILVHWTPRKWAGQELTDELRQSYVDHLKSICQEGLRFSVADEPEEIIGYRTSTKLPSLPIVCFTELRLSQVERHIKSYGSLGIGFRRAYLLGRGANPVFYAQNGKEGIVNTNLKELEKQMGTINGLNVFMSYVKPMSRSVDGELDFYDEMEWRVVAANLGRYCPFKRAEGQYYLNFDSSNVELLIFPDAQTRRMAISDEGVQLIFKGTYPMMLDAPDVGNI